MPFFRIFFAQFLKCSYLCIPKYKKTSELRKKTNIKLFLTSSPFIEGQCEITNANHQADLLRQTVQENAAALFIPANPDDRFNTAGLTHDYRAAFERQGLTFSRFAYLDHSNKEAAERLVRNSQFIVLGGGHLPTQMAFFEEINLREHLKYMRGVVLGISAGSMNSAIEVYATPEEPGEGRDLDFQRFIPGLGLTRRQIVPHYNSYRTHYVDDLRLFEDIIFPDSEGRNDYDGMPREFYILPDNSFIYCDGKADILYGEAWLCRGGRMQRINDNGNAIVLQ